MFVCLNKKEDLLAEEMKTAPETKKEKDHVFEKGITRAAMNA